MGEFANLSSFISSTQLYSLHTANQPFHFQSRAKATLQPPMSVCPFVICSSVCQLPKPSNSIKSFISPYHNIHHHSPHTITRNITTQHQNATEQHSQYHTQHHIITKQHHQAKSHTPSQLSSSSSSISSFT